MNNKMKQSFQNLYSAAQKGFNGLKGLWNDWTGNTQIDKQLAAQEKENAVMRDYNLKLAKMQNEWNIAQWERENAYNSPSAQKARLEAAGLNADMMYGQGGVVNTSSPSPLLSAGDSANPMDWSSLANKKSVGQAAFEAAQLDNLRAVTDKIEAETEKTLADSGLAKIDLEYRDAEKRLGLKLTEEQFKVAEQSWKDISQTIENKRVELEGLSLDNARKMIENAYQAEVYQKQLDILAKEYDIKEAEAKNALRYFAAQVLGLEADNAWKDAAWIISQKGGTPTLIKYGSETLSDLLNNIGSWIPKKKRK